MTGERKTEILVYRRGRVRKKWTVETEMIMSQA